MAQSSFLEQTGPTQPGHLRARAGERQTRVPPWEYSTGWQVIAQAFGDTCPGNQVLLVPS